MPPLDRCLWRAGLASIVALAAVSGAAPDSGPLFSADATVVALSGLPGDLEHARRYEVHARRLLETLAAAEHRPRRIVLLADDAAGVSAPDGLRVETRPSSRESFLALGRELAGQPGPLVLVVWGHGGAQGGTPVFHVRGPRLTADDFATFVGAPRARPLRGVLAFRGSGHVARALRGEGREIVSSESQVAFRDDPVAMELFLDVVRAKPGLDLRAASERLGRAVAGWYADQGLARTEDPTLWTALAAPVALVPPAPTVAASAAAGGPAGGTSPSEAVPPAEDRPPSAPGEREHAAWEGVSAVDAAAHAGSPAVVLRRRDTYTIGQSPALTHEVDHYVQVLTPEGVAYGDIDVAYSPPEERVTFLDLEVRSPDGQLTRLDPSEVHEAGGASLPAGYRAPSRKVFSLPEVKPGAILRVHYRGEWARFPLPHVLLDVPLAGDLPVRRAAVEVHVPTGTAFHWSFRDAARKEPAVTTSTYGTSYAWTVADTPAAAIEDLARPDGGARLLVSTFPDWAAYSAWYRRLVQHADEITPEIAATAARLAGGAPSDREKVRLLYHHVARMRYVAVPLGVNSHRPHAAAHVLRNGYGDCKDKANLFNTLLRSLGIAADLVLVPRFTQAEEGLPGHAFNHAISRVRLPGETLWIDTTDENCPFGLLPPGDPGRNVLVVDGVSRTLERLPAPDPAAHRLTILQRARLGSDGDAAGDLAADSAGHADYALRAAARDTAAVATRAVLAQDYRPASGAFSLARQANSGVSGLERDFRWTAEGTWSGLVSRLPAGHRLLRAPFWLPREWDQALAARRSPLFLNQGYPLTLVQEFRLDLPAGASGVALPPPRIREEGPLRFRLEWKPEPAGFVAALRIELVAADLDPGETAAFQQALRELLAAVADGPTLPPPS